MTDKRQHKSVPIYPYLPRLRDTTEQEFKYQYAQIFVSDKPQPNVCGDCIFFDGRCTTSSIEAKYGNANSPACSEFKSRK